MHLRNQRRVSRRASILLATLILGTLVALGSMGIMSLSLYHYDRQNHRILWSDAYYQAENVMLEGAQLVAEQTPDQFLGTYVLSGHAKALQLPYQPSAKVRSLTLTIVNDPAGVTSNFQITATANVNGAIRTLRGLVRKDPPSQVFDYEYFLNNWGWWWGYPITGNGDQRSNWDFDFRDGPSVNGHIYANGLIESNLVPVDPFGGSPPFAGLAGANPVKYTHIGVPRLPMPNLQDLSYYSAKANGTIIQNGAVLVNKVQGAGGGLPGIYLAGTADKPLVINGTVVIPGDVVLRGKITGKGTLYVGGNLYLADNVEYANGPDFSSNPGTLNTTQCDAWVDNANSQNKDLVAFAVKQSIFGGQVNDGSWRGYCYDPWDYGLGHIADHLIPYLENPSVYNYDYGSQIYMTPTRASRISNYPTDNSSGTPVPLDYNSVASSQLTHFQGIYYTNNAVSALSWAGPQYFDGGLISSNEAWVFSNWLTFRYDPRVHSRYQQKYFNGDPNRIIDLNLPIAQRVRFLDRYEISSAARG